MKGHITKDFFYKLLFKTLFPLRHPSRPKLCLKTWFQGHPGSHSREESQIIVAGKRECEERLLKWGQMVKLESFLLVVLFT